MTHLFDTDILSLWELGAGPEYGVIQLRLSGQPPGAVGVSIVTFHEQYNGCQLYLSRAKTADDLVSGYERLDKVLRTFVLLPVIPFSTAAAAELDRLRSLKLGVKPMDLRIAAIALAGNLTVVTRNVSDFARVPGLRTQDWSK